MGTRTDPALDAITSWWDADARALPWRASRDVYAIWVSEVMSTQTSVTRAAEAWQRWIARWPTVHALAAAALPDVLREWHGLGYPRRARDLHRAARIVVERGWPQDLTELPGVGAYIAAAVRCFAGEEPVLPLDVNVRRVLARRFPDGVDITRDPWRSAQALMEFGQRVCTAKPHCAGCPARSGCPGAEAVADGVDRAPRARRQAAYRGSLRERRGQLLARLLAERELPLADADAEAALSLCADELLRLEGERLLIAE